MTEIYEYIGGSVIVHTIDQLTEEYNCIFNRFKKEGIKRAGIKRMAEIRELLKTQAGMCFE